MGQAPFRAHEYGKRAHSTPLTYGLARFACGRRTLRGRSPVAGSTGNDVGLPTALRMPLQHHGAMCASGTGQREDAVV
jgi:hypothetical protein